MAFSGWIDGYGQTIIIDHGDHYYSVSGNLASVDVRLGDEITAGERLGTIGDEGQGPMLYFEIRHGAETLPPGPWLGTCTLRRGGKLPAPGSPGVIRSRFRDLKDV